MDHPRAVFGRVRLEDPSGLPLLKGLPLRDGKVQLGVGIDEESQRREGLLNHYVTFEAEYSAYAAAGYGRFVRLMKILLRKGYAGSRNPVGRANLAHVPNLIYLLSPRELMPHSVCRAVHAARGVLRPEQGPERRIVVYYCEQPPNRDSRVTLGDKRDALGVPRLVLDWRLGGVVTESVLALQEMLAGELEKRRIGTLEPGTGEPIYTDASHHMGTTRMGTDARASVVDTDCKVRGVENLYVASSSVFPSAGHANPTLTIVALALRLARHLRGS
jgi:choline dehydrogenase-like flavoprotein